MDIEEYLLGDCCVPWCASSTEVVECNVKPFVYFGMDGMIMIANWLRGFFLLNSFDLGGCTILVGAAYVEHVRTVESFVSSINIGW